MSDTTDVLRRMLEERTSTLTPPIRFDEFMRRIPEEAAALRQAIAQMKWQPIETAPKDGTPIIGGALSSWGRWLTDIVAWETMLTPEETPEWTWRWHAGNGTPQPTHWLPLPAPPKVTP